METFYPNISNRERKASLRKDMQSTEGKMERQNCFLYTAWQ